MTRSIPVHPDFPSRLEQWTENLRAFHLAGRDGTAALMEASSQARAGKLHRPPPSILTIMLLGASGGGKSELLNALAGARIAVSHHLRPTTTNPTVFAHNDIPLARLFEYGQTLGQLASHPEVCKTHDHPELASKIVIDAPDIDSYQTEHRQLVMELMPVVDIVLYVVTPYSYKDDLGWATVLKERGRRAFAFVINKWDSEAKPPVPEGQPDVDDDLARMLREKAGYDNPVIFRVSARYQAATPDERPNLPQPSPRENFQALKAWLETGLSGSRVEQIHRRRRRALWGALLTAIRNASNFHSSSPDAIRQSETRLEALPLELLSTWREAVRRESVSIAERRQSETRPRGFGLFRLLLSGVFGLAFLVRRFRRKKLIRPAPLTTKEIDNLSENASSACKSRLDSILWKLREDSPGIAWLEEKWEDSSSPLERETASAFLEARTRIENLQPPRWRTICAWTVVVLFELAAIALLGIAAWRIARGFLFGQYADLAFLLNFIALLLILVLTGGGLLALLYPDNSARNRKALESALAATWEEWTGRRKSELQEFQRTVSALETEGRALSETCKTELSQLNVTAPDDLFPEENRLPG